MLILLPEIALTAAFLDRFAERFGAAPGRMAFRPVAAARRAQVWAAWRGRGRMVVGARSALFLPFPTWA